MKYATYILAAVVLLVAIAAFWTRPNKATESDFLLDTYVSVTVYGSGAKKAAQAALDRVRELDGQLSAFRSGSDVANINRAGANVPTSVSEECFWLIRRALALSERTGGAFDITIKPVMDLWGFGSTSQAVPQPQALLEAQEKVGYQNVWLDEENKTVTLLGEGMAIDLGGIAKGYCADAAAEVLRQAGVEHAYLDFGGNVVTLGEIPQGLSDRVRTGTKTRPFVVGIQDPAGARGDLADTYTVQTSPCAIVTSGGYERYFEEDGKRYHHIIDPATGKQPENGIVSVTVIGPSSETADALSTALFVLGPDGCAQVDDLFDEVMFIFDTGEVMKIYPQGEQ